MYWNANYAIAETKVRHRASDGELISARCCKCHIAIDAISHEPFAMLKRDC
jgi:hypothetical protein